MPSYMGMASAITNSMCHPGSLPSTKKCICPSLGNSTHISSSLSFTTGFRFSTFPATSSFERNKMVLMSDLSPTAIPVLPMKKQDKTRPEGIPRKRCRLFSKREKTRLKHQRARICTIQLAKIAARSKAARRRACRQKRPKKVQLAQLEEIYTQSKRPTDAMVEGIGRLVKMNRRLVVTWFKQKRRDDGIPNKQPSIPFELLPMEKRLSSLPITSHQIIPSEPLDHLKTDYTDPHRYK